MDILQSVLFFYQTNIFYFLDESSKTKRLFEFG